MIIIPIGILVIQIQKNEMNSCKGCIYMVKDKELKKDFQIYCSFLKKVTSIYNPCEHYQRREIDTDFL
jgi:hypothetical protein